MLYTIQLKALKKLACIHVFKNKRKCYKIFSFQPLQPFYFMFSTKMNNKTRIFGTIFFSISSNSTLDRVIFSKSMINFENCIGNSNHWIRLDINVLCSVSISSGGMSALCGVHHSVMLPIAWPKYLVGYWIPCSISVARSLTWSRSMQKDGTFYFSRQTYPYR